MDSINKLIALVCKFWLLAIPYSIFTVILCFIVWIISLVSIGLAVLAFIILIVFGVLLWYSRLLKLLIIFGENFISFLVNRIGIRMSNRF